MILNKFAKPSQYMATIMFIWGIVVVCTGLIHNFGQLCAIRILLGLFEYVLTRHHIMYLLTSHHQGWLLSRRYPHHLEMVPPPRDANASRDSIYFCRHRRCFLRPLRLCHR